ncbi:MAG: acylneuraminate cytidylyltransferase family protein [Muribaculaceae bacterium]|nr:acylneuraminate cytidylyltransferase family protein [Muribaculaceae bacterium]
MSNILVTICARGGSKGIPGKNIKIIAGKPLMAYTVEVAKKFIKGKNAAIILSTDSEEIKNVGKELGIYTDYTRPDYLANDTVGKPDAIKDAMLWYETETGKKVEFVIDLDITSPIRNVEDIQRCLDLVKEDKEVLTSFSVNPAARNPYFNMVEETSDGYCKVVLGGKYTTRQSAPKVYDMNASIYVYRREALDIESPRAVTPRSKCYVMDHMCFDLDEPLDFEYLEFLLTHDKLKNIMG